MDESGSRKYTKRPPGELPKPEHIPSRLWSRFNREEKEKYLEEERKKEDKLRKEAASLNAADSKASSSTDPAPSSTSAPILPTSLGIFAIRPEIRQFTK